MSEKPKIDVNALKDAITLEQLIESCGVELKRNGKEYAALCPFHNERTPSFKVTPTTQLYYCSGCAAGGDHINFLQEFYGLGFKDAAHRLAEFAGNPIEHVSGAQPARRASLRADAEPPKWIKGPAPDNAPPCPKTLRTLHSGEWADTPVVAAWLYRDRDGRSIGYTCRVEFSRPDGTIGKDVIPVTWQTKIETGKGEWRQGAFEEPRPLYGADLLALNPDHNVLLVEGEKACDAARRMLAGRPITPVTWPGGCKAVEKADWSVLAGRKVVGWPDCDSQRDTKGVMRGYLDQPGMAAMLRIADILVDHSVAMRIVGVADPGTIDDGWDLADGEAEGWDGDRVVAEIKAHIATAAEIRSTDAGSEPGPVEVESGDEPSMSGAEGPGMEPDPRQDGHPDESPAEQRPKPARAPRAPRTRERGKGDDSEYVRALGYNHGRYYYLSGVQRQVHEYSAQSHGSTGLIQLAPLTYWQATFANGAPMKGENWQAATDALMRLCERQGIFDTTIIRGRGCWMDDGRMVLNLGNRLIADDVDVGIEEFDSDFIYEAGARLKGPDTTPLTVKESRLVLDIAKRFNWEMPASAALLAGWIVLAPLCGALPWRPHIWLTGGTGTGKSTIIEKFIVPLMAGMDLQVQGNSTEAGIRQSLRADAKPVIFDESEQNDEGEERRIQNVLALVRQSSSESQSRTLKGTTSGKHLEFHIRSMFCLASIQVGIKRQADQTRIGVLGLYGTSQVPSEDIDAHQERWLKTEQMLADLRDDPDYGRRLMARSVRMFDTIRENMRTFIRVAAIEFKSQRLGDQYGTLLAGTATLMYDHPITDGGALRFIRLFDWSTYLEAAREDESADALTSIMQIEVVVDFDRGHKTTTVGELVRIASDNVRADHIGVIEANTHLGRMGIKVRRGIVGQDAGILVANRSERLSKALRGAPWSSDWKSYLKRIPGAKPYSMPVTFAPGFSARSTFVPIEQVLKGDQEA